MTKLGSNAGLYTEDLLLSADSGFETNHSYQILISWAVEGRNYSQLYSVSIVGATTITESGGGSYPVALADMKLHLRIESTVTADDTLITTLISAATTYCEEFQRRSYITQTRVFYYDAFPLLFVVPYPPLISVTTIEYVDVDGDTQEVDTPDFRVDTGNEPGRITEAYNATWPATRDVTNAVILTVSEGYGDASAVPDTIKAAIKLIVGHWYENREEVVIGSGLVANKVPATVQRLLYMERRMII